MASSPQYVATPKNGVAQATVANTARDGTGTLATVYTAGALGSRVDSLIIQATGTTTAGMIRLFISNGSATVLIKELPVQAVTPSATIPAWSNEVQFPNGLIFQATWTLKAGTNNAETFNIIPIIAGDF